MERVGDGAMAEVWRAERRADGLPVAVKLVKPELAEVEGYALQFSAEVAAMAALDHPHIVRILDHGLLPGTPARPWLAMELGAATLRTRKPLDWPFVQRVVAELLLALAHAHARGVLHRDLKPSNVLLRSTDGHALLSDLGIAGLGASAAALTRAWGQPVAPFATPRFAAPEQVANDWRAEGPATDLYALGCTAWWAVCGAAPWSLEDPDQLAEAHASWPLPPLRPRFAVPPGLEAWLGRALEKAPQDRWDRALAALKAWFALGPAEEARAHRRQPSVTPAPTAGPETLADAPSSAPLATAATAPTAPSADLRLSRPPSRSRRESWPAPPEDPALPELSDGELVLPPPPRAPSLLGLRRPSLVGREAEQGALWSWLRAACAGRAPRALCLLGPPGVGARRLAAWLAERAHAHGVTETLAIDAAPSVAEAVRTALLTRWGLDELVEDELVGALLARGVQRTAARELLEQTPPMGALAEAVTHLGQGRRVLLEATGPLPGLGELLLAGRGGILAVVAGSSGEHDGAELELAPLPSSRMLTLLTQELHLAPALAAALAEGAGGRPGLALGWIRQALAEGALEVREGALHLARGSAAELGALDGGDRTVDPDWATAAAPGLAAVEARARAHLAAHDLDAARPLLLEAARGHLAGGSYAAAALRLDQAARGAAEPERGPELLLRARLDRHRAELGEAARWARRALRVAELTNQGALAARAHLELAWIDLYQGELEGVLRRLDEVLSPAVRIQAEAAGLRGNACFMLGRLDEAARAYGEAARRYAALGDDAGGAAALLGQGNVALAQGAHDPARERLGAACEAAERAGRRATLGDALNSLGEVARRCGELDEAAARYARAARVLRGVGSARALYPEANLAAVELGRGNADRCRRLVGQLLPRARRGGHRTLAVELLILEARCAVREAEGEAALQALGQAGSLLAETGLRDVSVADLLGALVEEARLGGHDVVAERARALRVAHQPHGAPDHGS